MRSVPILHRGPHLSCGLDRIVYYYNKQTKFGDTISQPVTQRLSRQE
jgi:hypothetical protein